MNKINKQFDPFFGSFILESLTIGMYGDSKTAIREYVQNAYDSLVIAISSNTITSDEAKVTIVLDADNNSITIRDNGVGLKSSTAIETLTNIGASKKDYKKQAGFRGIGRLSGLVLCQNLIFKTKFKGESIESVVEFNAQGLRKSLTPSHARLQSMKDILLEHVVAYQQDNHNLDDHFFEVTLSNLFEPPIECQIIDEMIGYLGEVAPVPYSDKFIQKNEILASANNRKKFIEEIKIFVHEGKEDKIGTQVFKHYSSQYLVQTSKVPLTEIVFLESPSGLWWGWVGKKSKSGFYKEDRIKGIRVRIKNIQIDGTQVIGRLFGELTGAASYARFNEWYIGEIFGDPDTLIPNARRDGFEEVEAWLKAKAELEIECKKLGKEAYDLSVKNQGEITSLMLQAERLGKQVEKISSEADPDITTVSKIISEIDKIQRKVNKASLSAENSTAGQLRTIETRLLQYHKKALLKIKTGTFISASEIKVKAEQDVVRLLIKAFNEELDRATFTKVMQVVNQVTGIIE